MWDKKTAYTRVFLFIYQKNNKKLRDVLNALVLEIFLKKNYKKRKKKSIF